MPHSSTTDLTNVANGDAPSTITIRRPDDMHVHLRDGPMLKAVADYTANLCSRAIIMPNLKPPVRTLTEALAYRERIMAAISPANRSSFTPLMTLYLTDHTTAEQIEEAYNSGYVYACKLYPAGATTNSAFGVTSYDAITPAVAAMERIGMVLCIHGEDASPSVDMFDREKVFLSLTLPTLLTRFPKLKVVLEHITTADAANFVLNHTEGRLAASITAHHLLYSRQALFEGAKIHPHMFCLPILKRETHRQALLKAIGEDDKQRFFAGTDSAPHPKDAKICPEGCAGIFTANAAVSLYTEAFVDAGLLDKLEDFYSVNGAKFYGLGLNSGSVTLEQRESKVIDQINVEGSEPIIPLRAGKSLKWTVI